MAAAGEPNIVEKLEKRPREQIFYFGQGGELNAVRWNDWKIHFAQLEGSITDATRVETSWPAIIHLGIGISLPIRLAPPMVCRHSVGTRHGRRSMLRIATDPQRLG